jgi:hypothetical protein
MARRTRYRNGDQIGLVECGCDGCSPSRINGVLCHESGCPCSWKDYAKKCIVCERKFYTKSHWVRTCNRTACHA